MHAKYLQKHFKSITMDRIVTLGLKKLLQILTIHFGGIQRFGKIKGGLSLLTKLEGGGE